ncbi:MAG: Ig-like domain-containing protein, partial [Candidatus Melainabacteria bacterium]
MSKRNQVNVASSSSSAPSNLQLEFYPQERIFSASIGCLIPFVADLGAHLAAASDLHAINFDFDYSSLNYPEFRWDNQFSESPMPGLLSHKHIDEAISIDTLNSQLLPNKFIKNSDFGSGNDFSREAANQPLIGPIPTAHGNNYHGDISQISTQIEDIGNAILNELRNINQYNFSDTIPNVPPIAVLDMPDMASSGVATMIDGALSHDVDGNIVQYTFDFGDGQYYSEGLGSSPDGKFDGKVEHEFADAGTYKVKLTVTDNKGATDFIYSSITILNDAPDAVNDGSLVSPIFTNEDTGLIIHVLDNDTDPNKNPLTVTTFTAASHGKLTLNPDNSILYTPDANYHGADQFTYTITDGLGKFDTATVFVGVNSINDIPVAVDDLYTTKEDTALIIAAASGILANDTDLDLDTLIVASYKQPSHGSVLVGNDGSLAYNPNKDFYGVDTFTYTVSDGNGGTANAIVTINVSPVDDPVDAVDDNASTNEEQAVNIFVLSNDTDFGDGDTLTVTNTSNPSNGSTFINPDGSIAYTPNKDFFGTDSFTYTITDGKGNFDTASVQVVVNPIDDAVDAIDDNAVTSEDLPVYINVLGNDTDFGDGDALTISGTGSALHGSVAIVSGQILYTPDSNYNGLDSFTYTIADGKGNFDTATVNLTINSINDPPVAVNDSATTSEDTAVTINVLSNDSDVDIATNGDVISIQSVGTPTNGTAVISSGQIKYTPNLNYFGTDSFTYTITDKAGLTSTATVNLTINSINDPPVAVNDSVVTNEDTAVTINVLSNDSDVDIATNGDVISIQSVGTPSNGTAVISSGQIKYTPNLNYFGTDSFTYTITDKAGLTSTATVDVTINPVNDPPVAVNDSATTAEDTPITINVLFNDSDVDIATNGDVISIQSVGTPSNGTAVISSGQILYTPKANFNGTDSFTYTVTDKAGLTSTATVNLTINPVNDPPVAVNDSVVTNEDTAVTINVLSNDTDVDIATNGDVISIQSVGTPSNGTAVISSGQIKYTPNLNYFGTDSFTYTITDKAGLTSTATVNLTINSINDPPVAVNDSSTTAEDTPITINVLANDLDPDIVTNGDVISIQSVGTPTNGTAVISAGQILYTPKANFNGVDSFTYIITDKAGLTSTATVNLTINPVNDPPVAVNDSVVTNEDTPITINVLANDTDPDIATNADVISIQSVGTPSNGTAVISSGQIKYTPNLNYFGTDSFTYTITDKVGLTSTATVDVTINSINDPPVAVNDSAITNEDTAVTINVLSNDTDPDIATNGDVISIKSVGSPTNGTAVISSGQILYTPKANFNGVDSFTYTIQD